MKKVIDQFDMTVDGDKETKGCHRYRSDHSDEPLATDLYVRKTILKRKLNGMGVPTRIRVTIEEIS